MFAKMLVLSAALAAVPLATAGDLASLDLVMPDAPLLVGVNFESARAAYAGSRLQEAVTPELRAQYERSWKQMETTLGYDLRQLQEVVVSVRPAPSGKTAQFLAILRAPVDPDHLPSLLATMPAQRTVLGDAVLFVIRPAKGDPLAVAFLGRTMALAGDPASVRAAIARWKAASPAHSPLLAKAAELHRTSHFWCLGRDLQNALPHAPAPNNADPMQKAFQALDEVSLSMTFAPDFKTSVELLAHTAKDAATLDSAVHVALAMAMTQAVPQKTKDLLAGLQVASQGRVVRVSLVIPEDKMIEALKEQMKNPPSWMGGQPAPGSTEVTVQGSEAPSNPSAPPAASGTQVIVLPK
jgi:hypothetical protein